MADRQNKRKQSPSDSRGAPYKKSKGGKAGRWKTPFEQARADDKMEMGKILEAGDEGIWVTFARGMKSKAVREFTALCEEYGKKMYGIKPPSEEDEHKDEEDVDIEASIKQELDNMKSSQKPKTRRTFTPITSNLECLFFMKTMKPVEPEALARKICEDARDCPDPMERKSKYVNRLTPVMNSDKATDVGIERVARLVMAPWFSLTKDSAEGDEAPAKPEDETAESVPPCTYAIRYNIRNNPMFKGMAVVQKVASLVSLRHKVNLSNPDKVILVEIFKHHCGVSVVDGKQWEALKKYNVNELYVLKEPVKTKEEKEVEEGADTAAPSEKQSVGDE